MRSARTMPWETSSAITSGSSTARNSSSVPLGSDRRIRTRVMSPSALNRVTASMVSCTRADASWSRWCTRSRSSSTRAASSTNVSGSPTGPVVVIVPPGSAGERLRALELLRGAAGEDLGERRPGQSRQYLRRGASRVGGQASSLERLEHEARTRGVLEQVLVEDGVRRNGSARHPRRPGRPATASSACAGPPQRCTIRSTKLPLASCSTQSNCCRRKASTASALPVRVAGAAPGLGGRDRGEHLVDALDRGLVAGSGEQGSRARPSRSRASANTARCPSAFPWLARMRAVPTGSARGSRWASSSSYSWTASSRLSA